MLLNKAILKGQANARLYPDKFSRETGDIDIWVEGGRESVLALLQTEPPLRWLTQRGLLYYCSARCRLLRAAAKRNIEGDNGLGTIVDILSLAELGRL